MGVSIGLGDTQGKGFHQALWLTSRDLPSPLKGHWTHIEGRRGRETSGSGPYTNCQLGLRGQIDLPAGAESTPGRLGRLGKTPRYISLSKGSSITARKRDEI